MLGRKSLLSKRSRSTASRLRLCLRTVGAEEQVVRSLVAPASVPWPDPEILCCITTMRRSLSVQYDEFNDHQLPLKHH